MTEADIVADEIESLVERLEDLRFDSGDVDEIEDLEELLRDKYGVDA